MKAKFRKTIFKKREFKKIASKILKEDKSCQANLIFQKTPMTMKEVIDTGNYFVQSTYRMLARSYTWAARNMSRIRENGLPEVPPEKDCPLIEASSPPNNCFEEDQAYKLSLPCKTIIGRPRSINTPPLGKDPVKHKLSQYGEILKKSNPDQEYEINTGTGNVIISLNRVNKPSATVTSSEVSPPTEPTIHPSLPLTDVGQYACDTGLTTLQMKDLNFMVEPFKVSGNDSFIPPATTVSTPAKQPDYQDEIPPDLLKEVFSINYPELGSLDDFLN